MCVRSASFSSMFIVQNKKPNQTTRKDNVVGLFYLVTWCSLLPRGNPLFSTPGYLSGRGLYILDIWNSRRGIHLCALPPMRPDVFFILFFFFCSLLVQYLEYIQKIKSQLHNKFEQNIESYVVKVTFQNNLLQHVGCQ